MRWVFIGLGALGVIAAAGYVIGCVIAALEDV